MINLETGSLRQQYADLKANQPRLRIFDAALHLGVSELELLELDLGDKAVRLQGDWKELLLKVHQMGYVMALTRNRFAVHERKGVYNNVSFTPDGRSGVVLNEDVDLRLFMHQWTYGYAVKVDNPRQTLYSLQFFNLHGEAIHKIYFTAHSDPLAYQAIVDKFRASDQKTPSKVKPTVPVETPQATHIDEVAFQQDWLQLKDTHDFVGLLQKYGLDRRQALRLAPPDYTRQLSVAVVNQMLKLAAAASLPIMVFVGNPGCIQIHTGAIENIVVMEDWINIIDPQFNLHLHTPGISEVWQVCKPTSDGIVTSVEVFSADGTLIVSFFGKRKPGIPELQEWHALTNQLV